MIFGMSRDFNILLQNIDCQLKIFFHYIKCLICVLNLNFKFYYKKVHLTLFKKINHTPPSIVHTNIYPLPQVCPLSFEFFHKSTPSIVNLKFPPKKFLYFFYEKLYTLFKVY